MSPEKFIALAILFFIPGMYGISMFWYSFVSKTRGIYIIEILVSLGALIGVISLVAIAYSDDVIDSIVAVFGAFFLIPVFVGAIISAVLVKLTIVYLKKDESNLIK